MALFNTPVGVKAFMYLSNSIHMRIVAKTLEKELQGNGVKSLPFGFLALHSCHLLTAAVWTRKIHF